MELPDVDIAPQQRKAASPTRLPPHRYGWHDHRVGTTARNSHEIEDLDESHLIRGYD